MAHHASEQLHTAYARRLRLYLAAMGWSLKHFSTATEVPYRTMQDLFIGKRYPSGEQLERFAVVGVDATWLLTGRVRLPGWQLADLGSGEEVLGADQAMLDQLAHSALALADGYAERSVSKSGRTLATGERIGAAGAYLAAMFRTAGSLDEAFEDLLVLFRKPQRLLVQMLSAAASELTDEAIAREVERVKELTTAGRSR